MNAWIIPACLLGYVLGSIPFALVIGKVFYGRDVRLEGSGNLGGSNAGRVLGAKAGVAVMALDLLKVVLAVYLSSLLPGGEENLIASGLCAAAGHCWPVFASFRGGKAVATMYGFLAGMVLFGGKALPSVLLPLAVFIAVLYATRIISLSSILSAAAALAYQAVTTGLSGMTWALAAFLALMVWRHRENLRRLVRHEENRIKWM